ncbi:MAG TPA: hypothetical protein VMU22_09325 [Rhizomicrobium sp.]|nr:hypothetical protein [Rhizomicrobium sp.]
MHDFSHYLHEGQYYLSVVITFLLDGFREGFARVNAVLGLFIALVFTYMMPAWNRIWAITLGATVVLLIAEVLLPVIANHESFHLPRNLLETSYWRTALALYFGFLVVIAVFFFLKTAVLPKPKAGGGKH